MSSTDPQHDPRRETWQAGDYSQASAQSVLVSELLCEAVEMRANEKVLDVACGTGVTALAAARRRAVVTGIDFAPNALEQARTRAAFEGLQIEFQEGNAEELPFPDESFDVVLSTFGAQFVADQEAVAREMMRVCRSGGRIGLANWTPRGFFGHFFKLMTDYAPPQMRKSPIPDKPGVLWGTEERLDELFGDGVESIRSERRVSRSRFRSVEDWVDQQTESLGPVVQIMNQLDAETGERFREALSELVRRFNLVSGPDVLLESDYLEVVMVRR